MTTHDPEAVRNLKAILDHIGLSLTLELLADICDEKADHLRHNWQDESTALAWERAGRTIIRIADHTSITALD